MRLHLRQNVVHDLTLRTEKVALDLRLRRHGKVHAPKHLAVVVVDSLDLGLWPVVAFPRWIVVPNLSQFLCLIVEGLVVQRWGRREILTANDTAVANDLRDMLLNRCAFRHFCPFSELGMRFMVHRITRVVEDALLNCRRLLKRCPVRLD
jgi:hypothetical protein